MTSNLDSIALKQRLSFNLSGQDPEALHTTALYLVYKTIETNRRLTLKSLKALLMVEFMLEDQVIEGALSGLMSVSMFNCVKRWQQPNKTIEHLLISVTEPPPAEFEVWLKRAEDQHPELRMLKPPKYQQKPDDKDKRAA